MQNVTDITVSVTRSDGIVTIWDVLTGSGHEVRLKICDHNRKIHFNRICEDAEYLEKKGYLVNSTRI